MQMPTPSGERPPPAQRTLRASIDYERDGTILFRLDGHETPRFERVLASLRATIPVAEREWHADLGLWVIDAGWDEELLEILEDYFDPADILVSGLSLDAREEETLREEALPWPIPRGVGRHGWLDLNDLSPPLPDRWRLGHLIIPDWDEPQGSE
jgi:hypothetical protein